MTEARYQLKAGQKKRKRPKI